MFGTGLSVGRSIKESAVGSAGDWFYLSLTFGSCKGKGKGKGVPLHAIKALGGRGGIAPTHN
jgi:hypothetical protein